jgi:hypothetical protein
MSLVQLTAMKTDLDWILAQAPQDWEKRLDFVGYVAGRRNTVTTWLDERRKAAEIWSYWKEFYTFLSANPPAFASPPRSLSKDVAAMTACRAAFTAAHNQISAMLTDNGLKGVKRTLTYQWYLVADKVIDGVTDEFYDAALDESVSDFQRRFKALINAWIKPGKAKWLEVAEFNGNGNCYVTQLDDMPAPLSEPNLALQKRRVHWTVFKDQLTGLDILRTTNPIAEIKAALLPCGTAQYYGFDGVHVTWEYADNPNQNPRVFGRPATWWRNFNYDGAFHDRTVLTKRLNDENVRLEGLLATFVSTRNACLRDRWADY